MNFAEHTAAAISRGQPREPAPTRSVFDASATCQRCRRKIRLVSARPITVDDILAAVCIVCSSGEAA